MFTNFCLQIFVYKFLCTNFYLQLYFLEKEKQHSLNLKHFENENTFWKRMIFLNWKLILKPILKMKTCFLNWKIINHFFFSGLVYSTFSLLSTIVFLIMASHFNGWKLDRKFGIILLIWYFIFMIFASLYELNVFGFANLPTCDSDF